jgi:hypothetical protein
MEEGRIVVDCPLDLKRKLYSYLSLDGITMKDWFRVQVETYLDRRERREQTEKAKKGKK